MMVLLKLLLQSFQNGNGLLHRRLLHGNRLESPLESGVLLDIFAVFLAGGGSDQLKLPSGQERLYYIGSIDGAFCAAGANHRMNLIHKQ